MKRNCWYCANDEICGGGHCCYTEGVDLWVCENIDVGSDMPPRDADGCPGWEPKHENADYWKRQARIMCAEARGWRAAFESMMMDEETCRKGVVQVSRVDNQLNHLRGEK